MSVDQPSQEVAPPTYGGLSVALRANMAEFRQEYEREDAGRVAAVPEGNGSLRLPISIPSPDPNHSVPFPLEGGTGTDGIGSSTPPVPTAGNGSGTENGSTTQPPLPTPTYPNRFLFRERASEASAPNLTDFPPKAGSSWSEVNIAGIVDGLVLGTLDRPKPSIGRLADGSHWLYRGCTNGLAGESGSGKTWTALATVATELQDGNSCVYIDMEDSPIGIVSRLLDLGIPSVVIANPRRFAYVQPEVAFKDDVRAEFWALLTWMKPSLVVLDSTGESMAIEGTDPNSDTDVAEWFRRVATAIATGSGAAVLLLDHLPKSDNAAASPIGSQRKRAAISGVQMIQTVPAQMAFARGRAGQAKLTCTKDRHGYFVTGEPAVVLTVNPDPLRGETGVNVVLSRVVEGGEQFANTRIMLRISEFLEAEGSPQSTAEIKKGVRGKAQTLTDALRVLVSSGYVLSAPGSRNSNLYELVQPYKLGDLYTVPDDMDGDDSTVSDGCAHEWHDGACRPAWCHTGHHGSCNRGHDAEPSDPRDWLSDEPPVNNTFQG